MWQTKPINHFENRGDWIFIQICPKDEISQKSRKFWTETQHQGCDKINISWIEIDQNRFPIYIRRVCGQNTTIGEGSDKNGKSLNRPDSKSEDKLGINLNHE